MKGTSQDQPSSSVQLDGFAPASGSGAGSSSASAAALQASSSEPSAPAAAAPPAADVAKKPAAEAKRAKKRAPTKKGVAGGGGGGGGSPDGEGDAAADNLSEETELVPLSGVKFDAFEPVSLPQIQLRLRKLLDTLPAELPPVPPGEQRPGADVHYGPVKSFASSLQIAIEEYNLLLSLVSAATYKWGVDRSGASQQNLSVMSAELQQCQDVIANVVSARLSNVLCPAVDVLIGEVEIVRESGDGAEGSSSAPAKKRKLNEDRLGNGGSGTGGERRINHYTRPLVDPAYVHLCHCILARNAELIRHTVATSIHAAYRVIGDYLKAMKKDSSHEAGKGGYY